MVGVDGAVIGVSDREQRTVGCVDSALAGQIACDRSCRRFARRRLERVGCQRDLQAETRCKVWLAAHKPVSCPSFNPTSTAWRKW